MKIKFIAPSFIIFMMACNSAARKNLKKEGITPQVQKSHTIISREKYHDQLHGFWLGQCIGNWTGLITEMDKIGNIGDIKTGAFYTRENWGKPDLPSIWGQGIPSDISPTIDFVFKEPDEIWGADDDTDIEYMYLHLLLKNKTTVLTPQQIRNGWLNHIKEKEENFLWVSNQKAFDLMQLEVLPPETGNPKNNPHYEMIDAQLTTEIFGLFAPTRPDVAIKMARLPIQTVARTEAEQIAQFYVSMHALASLSNPKKSLKKRLFWMANQAKKIFPETSYAAHMFNYTKKLYESGIPWEQTRDSIYFKYQVNQEDGYKISSKKLYCNGCFAAGINFAASLVSLFYGEGDLKKTIQISTLAGWDSDNPSATWGGLLGFMIGKDGIEKTFNRKFSNLFNIHRTRKNFPNNGIDSFDKMAKKGILVVDRVVLEELGGTLNLEKNVWIIPRFKY